MDRSTVHPVHDRMMVQFARNGVLYTSEDHFVYASRDSGSTWQQVCEIENRRTSAISRAKSFLLRSGIVRRLRRNIGINNVVVLPSGTVIIQYDGIYRYDGTGTRARHVCRFSDHNLQGPLKNGLAVDDSSGNLYFGEYNNTRPYSVRIVRGTDDGRKWEICHQFPPGKIKHVHSIVPDPFRNRLWICTGDADQEAHLFYTDDDFRTVRHLGGQSQRWRMVTVIPAPDSLIWGSDAGRDAPAADNYIYRYDLADNRIERLQYINKPAYYATRLSDGTLAIGTTYEPGQQGVEEESADIWISRDAEQWKRVAALPFQPSGRSSGTRYGTVNLPAGDDSLATLFFTPVNVRKYDFSLLECRT
ncbi:hypothetical protein LPW11_14745 [Geomonas sp. RF6]|uniref:hypothetical protein n=1 Tax=Geomonas sp. RF6 TaxID=2897342 RepID=UPI001E4B70AB|nr:hypothetical protein [Geomonas sp. RF6]UFS69149.1 hypothetical protein LPW11_14745 [Geomonas sp. RF6]